MESDTGRQDANGVRPANRVSVTTNGQLTVLAAARMASVASVGREIIGTCDALTLAESKLGFGWVGADAVGSAPSPMRPYS